MNERLRTRIDSGNLGPQVYLSNGLLTATIMPEIGGRVMGLALGEKNVIYTNPRYADSTPLANDTLGKWRNYGGSKVWPAPQGWSSENEWPGPPDPVLDSGPYRFHHLSDEIRAFVHLESQHDEYSGVTLERTIEISPNTATIRFHHKMRNTARRRVRWSIWQVTQLDAARGLDVFMSAKGFQQTLGNETYSGMIYDAARNRVHLRYENQVAKFAVAVDQGWIASLDAARGIVLVETFPILPGAEYPDGAPVAFWTSGQGTFTIHGDTIDMSQDENGCDSHIETEIMGPITTLGPGESSELHTAWQIAAIEAQQIVSVNDCAAIARPLTVTTGTDSTLTASFGVFHEARLRLDIFNRGAQRIDTIQLGDVSPLRPVVINKTISLTAESVRATLILIDQNNQGLGTIDHVQIR